MTALLPTNLLVTCLLMFVGAIGSGALPVLFNMGKEWVSWVRSQPVETQRRNKISLVAPRSQ